MTLDEILNSDDFKKDFEGAEYIPDYTGAEMDTQADTGRYPEHMNGGSY